jgi:hypothetical protein
VVDEYEIGSVHVNFSVDKIGWGIFEDKPVCILGISITANSILGIVKFAKFDTSRESFTLPSLQIPTKGVKVVLWRPEVVSGLVTRTETEQSYTLSPN